jgi:hypothetical protein
MTYYLSYYNDTLAAGASLTFPKDAIHRLFYVWGTPICGPLYVELPAETNQAAG